MTSLVDKISKTWKKHERKIAILGVTAFLGGMIAISESQKIGSYRPEGLSRAYTSYVAYDKGNSIWLFPPVLKGFGHGPMIDEGKDGTVDYVGNITYPRMPISFSHPVEIFPEVQRQRIQEGYDEAMAEINKSR